MSLNKDTLLIKKLNKIFNKLNIKINNINESILTTKYYEEC